MSDATRRSLILGIALAPLSLPAAWPGRAEGRPEVQARDAGALPRPESDVILTVTGALPRRNSAKGALFDRAMLKSLGEVEFTSSTPWSERPQRFRGPTLHALIETLGLRGGNFIARALNDYSIPVPVSEGVPGGPILAMEIDGQEMSLRERGPLWLIYPFDQVPAYRSEVSYIRSIWQLTQLDWQNDQPDSRQAG